MARPTGTPIQKNSPTKDFSLAAGETTSDSWGLDTGFEKVKKQETKEVVEKKGKPQNQRNGLNQSGGVGFGG